MMYISRSAPKRVQQEAKRRKDAGGKTLPRAAAAVKKGLPPVLDSFDLPANDGEQVDFYGRVKPAFDPSWTFCDPFVLSGQAWATDLMNDTSLKDFMMSFQVCTVSAVEHI
jgi:hypothetical protein